MKVRLFVKDEPYTKIQEGKKTIELRLDDEKRRLIEPGDIITFTHSDSFNRTIKAKVVRLHRFDNFKQLYKELDLTLCGYAPKEKAKHTDMEEYYTPAELKKYGVVGIEFKLI